MAGCFGRTIVRFLRITQPRCWAELCRKRKVTNSLYSWLRVQFWFTGIRLAGSSRLSRARSSGFFRTKRLWSRRQEVLDKTNPHQQTHKQKLFHKRTPTTYQYSDPHLNPKQTQLRLKQIQSCLLPRKDENLNQRIPLLPEKEWQANAAKLKVVGKEALFTACPPKKLHAPLNDTLGKLPYTTLTKATWPAWDWIP